MSNFEIIVIILLITQSFWLLLIINLLKINLTNLVKKSYHVPITPKTNARQMDLEKKIETSQKEAIDWVLSEDGKLYCGLCDCIYEAKRGSKFCCPKCGHPVTHWKKNHE